MESTITISWPNVFTMLGGMVVVLAAMFAVVKSKLKILWSADIDIKLSEFKIDIDKQLTQVHTELMEKMSSEFKLIKHEIDTIGHVAKDLRGIIGRYQEQQTVSQIESARISERLHSVDQRLSSIEEEIKRKNG